MLNDKLDERLGIPAPPDIGDLLLRTLLPGEPVPPGWTQISQTDLTTKKSQRLCYRIYVGTESPSEWLHHVHVRAKQTLYDLTDT